MRRVLSGHLMTAGNTPCASLLEVTQACKTTAPRSGGMEANDLAMTLFTRFTPESASREASRDAEKWQRKQQTQREKRDRQREEQITRERQQREKQLAQQMREIDHHGEHLARTANTFAVFLLAVFSLASLLSLSAEAFNAFMRHLMAHQIDILDALNIVINVTLVLCMDIGMFYAASVINAILNAGGKAREMWQHVAMMTIACLLEASTYIYLVVQYDRPTNAWLWAIGIGRGLAAPLFSVYLSLARKLPIAPRDVAYFVSLLAGKGMIHDIGMLAGDRDAPLERKVAIYTSSAMMTADQRRQFEGIITAVNPGAFTLNVTPEAKRQEEPKPTAPATPEQPEPQRPAPVPFPAPQRQEREQRQQPTVPALAPAAETQRRTRTAARNQRNQRGLGRTFLTLDGDSATAGAEQQERAQDDPVELATRREAAARRILAQSPQITTADLARQIAIATQHKINAKTASGIRKDIATAHEQERRFHVVPTPPAVRVVEGSIEREDGEEERAEN